MCFFLFNSISLTTLEFEWNEEVLKYGKFYNYKFPTYNEAKRIFRKLVADTVTIYGCTNRYCEHISHNKGITCECGSKVEHTAVIFDIIPRLKSFFKNPEIRKHFKHHLSQFIEDIITDICQAPRFHFKKQLYGNLLNDIYVGLHQDG